MGVAVWISQNWFDLFSAIGIIGGLWFTAVSLHSETKTRRIANLLTITINHRELWKEFLHNPELARVLDHSANVMKHPVTQAEEIFVNMMIIHINSVYYATHDELLTNPKQRGKKERIVLITVSPIWPQTGYIILFFKLLKALQWQREAGLLKILKMFTAKPWAYTREIRISTVVARRLGGKNLKTENDEDDWHLIASFRPQSIISYSYAGTG